MSGTVMQGMTGYQPPNLISFTWLVRLSFPCIGHCVKYYTIRYICMRQVMMLKDMSGGNSATFLKLKCLPQQRELEESLMVFHSKLNGEC